MDFRLGRILVRVKFELGFASIDFQFAVIDLQFAVISLQFAVIDLQNLGLL